ncbi:hypothetical protein ACFWBI_26840 [Streptomyces sp. NPDC059982]|uniref:hypothetical protein n=2 Tax=unclassified Streptomyces TaxID=2593676 RepID=UPI00368890D3
MSVRTSTRTSTDTGSGSRRGARQWVATAAGVAALAALLAAGLALRPSGGGDGAAGPAGAGPARSAVLADLAAATEGLPAAPPATAEEGPLADCLAGWAGAGPAGRDRIAALETALTARGRRVVSRGRGPATRSSLTRGA